MHRQALLATLIIATALLAGCAQNNDDTVKVGVMLPLSGDAASYGQSIKRGIDLAHQDLNASVELIYEDTQCDPKAAVTAFTKLATVDRVDVVIGEVCSGATLAAAPIAEQHGLVLISPASTSPKISDAGEHLFRTVPSDALQGAFGAQLVYDNGGRRLAILFSNEEYGLGFSDVLRRRFEELGGDPVAGETFSRGSQDLRTQIVKIRQANPDAIYLISNSPDSAVAALRQLRDAGINATIYGSEGLKSDAILQGAGSAAEGLIVTSVSSGTTAFAQRHQEAYGGAPGPFAAQGYDAFSAIALAAGTESRQINRTVFKDAIGRLSFNGASGAIDFDENGDIAGNYDVYVVRDGAFTLEAQE